jgi:hypothetical protein
LNFLGEHCSNGIYIFIFYFISISSYCFFFLKTTNKDPIYEKDFLKLTFSNSCYNVLAAKSKVVTGSKKDATIGVKWHNDGVGTNSLALLLQWLTTKRITIATDVQVILVLLHKKGKARTLIAMK